MIGKGSTLTIGGDSIGRIEEIVPPPYSRDMIETTNMGSTVKEYEAGFGGYGPSTFRTSAPVKGLTDATNYYDSILGEIDASTAAEVVITDPSTKVTWTFNAFVTGWDVSMPTQDKIMTEVTLHPTGTVAVVESV